MYHHTQITSYHPANTNDSINRHLGAGGEEKGISLFLCVLGFCFFLFLRQGLIFNPVWPRTHCLSQIGSDFMAILQSQHPE